MSDGRSLHVAVFTGLAVKHQFPSPWWHGTNLFRMNNLVAGVF